MDSLLQHDQILALTEKNILETIFICEHPTEYGVCFDFTLRDTKKRTTVHLTDKKDQLVLFKTLDLAFEYIRPYSIVDGECSVTVTLQPYNH